MSDSAVAPEMKLALFFHKRHLSGLRILPVILAWGLSVGGPGSKAYAGDFSSPLGFRLDSGGGWQPKEAHKPVSMILPDCCLARSPDSQPAPVQAPPPVSRESAEAAAKADELTPAAGNTPVEPVRKHDGGVPVEAAEFHGTVTGCVETIGRNKIAFRLKITAVSADAMSKAVKPESLISAVVLIIEGTERSPDGKLRVRPGHHEWIATVQPGNLVVVPVRYAKSANGFKMIAVPLPPIVPGTCSGTDAAASAPAPNLPRTPPTRD